MIGVPRPPDDTQINRTAPLYLIAFAAVGVTAIIAADYVGEAALTDKVILFLGTVGSVLFVSAQVGRVSQKTDAQTKDLKQIKHSLNGELGERVKAEVKTAVEAEVGPRLTRLENALVRIEQRLPGGPAGP